VNNLDVPGNILNNRMNVLSLFDGISCARVALERQGFKIEKYYASEIDKYAIHIAQKNYPDTIQVGNVTELNGNDFTDIDLLIGGSPCQDSSIAKKVVKA
jgi:site-specific DNA-cytosine methylase